jgi:hypothetical protein
MVGFSNLSLYIPEQSYNIEQAYGTPHEWSLQNNYTQPILYFQINNKNYQTKSQKIIKI